MFSVSQVFSESQVFSVFFVSSVLFVLCVSSVLFVLCVPSVPCVLLVPRFSVFSVCFVCDLHVLCPKWSLVTVFSVT